MKIATTCVAKLKFIGARYKMNTCCFSWFLVILHFKLKTGQLTHSYVRNMYSINHALNKVTARQEMFVHY